MGGKSGSETTVGYKYYLGMQMAMAHGPLDTVTRIEVDRRIAWEGVNEGGALTIDAEDLFGGDGREGGVSGTVDIDMGLPTQLQNSYLQSVLGNDIPAFRGVACAVLNQVYTGNNPYLKPWSFRAQRIFVTSDGSTQWYSAKAAIAAVSDDCDVIQYACNAFAYGIPGDVTVLAKMQEPFYADGNSPTGWYAHTEVGPPLVSAVGNTVVDNPMIPEACYNSWNKQGGGVYELGDGVLVLDKDDSFSAGFLLEYDASSWTTGIGQSLISKTWSIQRYPDGTPASNIIMGISMFDTTYGPYDRTLAMSIKVVGGSTYYKYYDLDDLVPGGQFEPNDPHWYHFSGFITFSGNPGSYTSTVSANAYVDGAKVLTDSYVDNGGSGPYTWGVREDNTHIGLGSDYDGWINNVYIRNSAFSSYEIDDLARYWEANFVDYDADLSECACVDMNPAHIIRECLTDSAWGMGYTSSDMDDTAFMAAADTLYDESMGMSLLWDREMPLEEFIAEILRHIDGVLYVDRKTGKFVLNLVRDDYQNDSTLVVLDEDNVAGISDAKRPTTGELTSSITVNFWDRGTGETGSVTEHNWPLIQIQGSQTHTTIQYPGFTNYTIAQQVALRDLVTLSTPLLSCRIEAGREAAELNIGDAFILDWPDLDINSLVMRVQQMSLGDTRDNTVIIEAAEDAFFLPVARSNTTPGDVWVDPIDGTPDDSVPRIVSEAPYYEVVRVNGEINTNDILANNNDSGFLLVAGGRQGDERNANVYIDDGGGYSKDAAMDFSPYGILVSAIEETDTQIYIESVKDLDLVSTGTIAQIGSELVRVDGIGTDSNGTYVNVGRGILDTVPQTHGLESSEIDSNNTNRTDAIVFWHDDAASDNVEYTASESLNVKLQTTQGSSVLSLDYAPEDSVTFNSRAYRPYPAGNLQIDGEGYPEANTSTEIYWNSTHLITWAYRDRTQQTDGNLYDYTTGDIGPETGTTYRIDMYSTLQDGTTSDIWWTLDAGQVNSYQMDSSSPDSSRGDPVDGTELVHIKVTAIRDGYESLQAPVATLSYISDSNS